MNDALTYEQVARQLRREAWFDLLTVAGFALLWALLSHEWRKARR